MNNIVETLMNHRSIRKYKEEPVKQEDLDQILKVVQHGQTSVNGQQFSVIVIKDPSTKAKIDAMTGGQEWISKAPVFLLFVSDFSRIAAALEKDSVPFENIESVESTMVGSVDSGIAFGLAMAVAESMGYGIVPIGAVRREPYDLTELLQLPKYVYPVVGMCIGVPDDEPALKPRFPLHEIVHEEVYHPMESEALAEYDQIVKDYMNKRTNGEDVRSWSDSMKYIYSRVYFPKVIGSLEQQGYSNTK